VSTHVMACTSPSRLATLSIESSNGFVALHCRRDCYRLERTSSRAGVARAEGVRPFAAHYYVNLAKASLDARRLRSFSSSFGYNRVL
jgi:hypothetical protein